MDNRKKPPRSDHSASDECRRRTGSTSPPHTYSDRASEYSRGSSHSEERHRSYRRDNDSDRNRRHREHRERRESRYERKHRSSRDSCDDSRRHRHHHREKPAPAPEATEPSSRNPILKRDDWMSLGDPEANDHGDFFASMGYTKDKTPKHEAPNPDELQVHARELNPSLNPNRATVGPAPKEAEYGAPGHKWRMMKLERTYEMAEQNGVAVEQVALDRYGSMEAFDEARRERQYLEDRGILSQSRRERNASRTRSGGTAFRRPGTVPLPHSAPHAPKAPQSAGPQIPSVLPQAPLPSATPSSAMSLSELNKFEAKVMRAEMTQQPNAATLRAELEKAKQANTSQHASEHVEALPVIDGFGRMYDVGTSRSIELETQAATSKKRPKHATDGPEDESLAELVRQERLTSGPKSGDAAMAQQIATDRGFENDLDYMDDEAQRFARKKMRDDAMKRQFAIQDFARTKRALDECTFCWQDEGRMPPRANIVSSGTCAYLALPDREPLVDGHCWIVPLQHHVSSLDVDENGWTEIRNFMKCLIRMGAARNQTMVFFETVLSLRQQKHTYIEAVPIPNDVFAELPAYFKASLSEVESEWSDHAQIIYFSQARPFQRSMVSRLPYFMIQWDYKGERGYGHVIESRDDEYGRKPAGVENDEPAYADGDHVGGAGFPKYVHNC